MLMEKLERDTLRCKGKEVRGSKGKEAINVLLVRNRNGEPRIESFPNNRDLRRSLKGMDC